MTNVSTVLERVTKVIVDRLGVDESEVQLEKSFREDLGADSLEFGDYQVTQWAA